MHSSRKYTFLGSFYSLSSQDAFQIYTFPERVHCASLANLVRLVGDFDVQVVLVQSQVQSNLGQSLDRLQICVWVLWQNVDAVVCDSWHCVAVVSYSILFIEMNHPVANAVRSNFLDVPARGCGGWECGIDHDFVAVSDTALKGVDVVGVLFFYVDLSAGAVALKVGTTGSLILGDFVPFAFVVVDWIVWRGWRVAAGCSEGCDYKQG